MDKSKFILAIALSVITSLTSVGHANDDNLPLYLQIKDLRVTRCSQAELKAFRFFHVGYAALYKTVCQANNTVFDLSPKRLRFVYKREIPARAFREAADEYLEINLGKKFHSWRQKIKQFNQGYRDIAEGDIYDLIYHPNSGLKLYLNDLPLASLDDPEIGLAYFNIWFGNEPFSEELKKSLSRSDKS